jgi:DNA-formamidopyrimidine glycosylase
MKAIRIHEYGGPEALKLDEAPRPTAGPEEVLIRVHAAGVNPVDWKVREGYLKDRQKRSLPFIPGWDVSGVVEEAGAKTSRLKPGDEVYCRPDLARDGGYAEYIVVRENEVALKPKTIDHVHAAGVPLAALTAWQVLFDEANLQPGQKVLIHAAAGGVGHYAVQLAKWKGAHVAGTASEKNHDFLRELGADEVIDYRKRRFEEVIHDADVVFDTLAGDTQERSWKTLKKGGTLVSILSPPSKEKAAAQGARAGYVFVQPNANELMEVANLIDAGKIKPFVQSALPLAEARAAQEISQGGTCPRQARLAGKSELKERAIMPELPDVEMFRRYLDSKALHQRIHFVQVEDDAVLDGVTAKSLQVRLKGHEFKSTRRHGKNVFIAITGRDEYLRLHFGMTGGLTFLTDSSPPPRHTRVLFHFNGHQLAFLDQRKLGAIGLVAAIGDFIGEKKLGPDALEISDSQFRARLGGRCGGIKPALMDQQLVAGLGNVYADELLFHARTHPKASIETLNRAGLKKIYCEMQTVLKKAIECRADIDRLPRSWMLPHRGRDSKCPRCAHAWERIKAAGRTTYLCPNCQPHKNGSNDAGG